MTSLTKLNFLYDRDFLVIAATVVGVLGIIITLTNLRSDRDIKGLYPMWILMLSLMIGFLSLMFTPTVWLSGFYIKDKDTFTPVEEGRYLKESYEENTHLLCTLKSGSLMCGGKEVEVQYYQELKQSNPNKHPLTLLFLDILENPPDTADELRKMAEEAQMANRLIVLSP